ncbi:MAG: hypothetical protein ACOYXU_11055 [Nitrospirota bacterium]
MMTREIEQLATTANHYLAEARRLLANRPDLGSLTIGEVTRRHKRGSLSPAEVVLAHFGSAAVRLATMCEIADYRPTENYRRKFYKPSGERKAGWSDHSIKTDITATLHEHLHVLLRDNIAHEEPGIANSKQIAADRFAILKATTIDTCRHVLDKISKRLSARR